MVLSSEQYIPQDIVSIFHCSFHPTKGNVIDWSLKAIEDLDLTNVEFNTLPSGLHLVEEDVVYFTKGDHQGVSVFRRRKTAEQGHRGFRLSSFGILLAKSARPRPWRHVQGLKALSHSVYSDLDERGVLEPVDSDWAPARAFFEERKIQGNSLGGAGDWKGWSDELDGPKSDSSTLTTHLPHLLRILGLSTLTLYKHVLGRRRILIYTLPPVEASCILCQVAADMCYEDQVDYEFTSSDDPPLGVDDGASLRLKGRCRESVRVLGMVTLTDLDMLERAGKCGRGWIACTTDAIFLERPSYYDLIIDLTTCTPFKASFPSLYLSRPVESPANSRAPTHRLSSVRFAWSDVKLWGELERLLDRDSQDNCCAPSSRSSPLHPSAWADVWRLYEDVCIICAGLWMGTWRNNSVTSYSTVDGNMANWGQIRLEGDNDISIRGPYVRNLGMGIEGRPPNDQSNEAATTSVTRKASKRGNMTSLSSKLTIKEIEESGLPQSEYNMHRVDEPLEDQNKRSARERQVLITLALLQTFHAHTAYVLSRLSSFLPSTPLQQLSQSSIQADHLETVTLTPKDLLSFELGPLSSLDARFVEWLGDEYGSQFGVRIVTKKSWRDLVGLVFGFG